MTLNPDGWRRVESLFHAAADLSDEAREAILAHELEQSHEVVDAVRRMLAADDGPHALLDADALVILSEAKDDTTAQFFRTIDQLTVAFPTLGSSNERLVSSVANPSAAKPFLSGCAPNQSSECPG